MIDKNYISPLEEGGGETGNNHDKQRPPSPFFFKKKGGGGFCVCVIRKKGYGVYILNKKSLHALDKTQSKGTVLLLPFFISKSQ